MMFRRLSVARSKPVVFAVFVAILPIALAGCAGDGVSSGGDPGAMAMPAGQSCQSVRAELNKMDGTGIQGKFETLNRGQKLSPAAQADVDKYNRLLNTYLGARCHV
jgi:hypothetical protein